MLLKRHQRRGSPATLTGMSHRCPALKKRPPHARCENQIAKAQQKYCGDHKHPWQRYQGPPSPPVRSPRPSPPRKAPQGRPVAPQPRPPSSYEIWRAQVNQAAEVVDEIVTEGWKKAVSARINSVLTDNVMEELWAQARGGKRSVLCKKLAEEARFLLGAQNQFRDAIAATADRVLRGWRRPLIERLIAERLAHHVPLPGNEQIVALARILQNYGIWICVMEGKHPSTCRCLQDISTEEVRQIIGRGVDRLQNPELDR